MKLSFFAQAALLLRFGFSYPLSALKRTDNIDVTILQFALTLEHLENVFYKEALVKFSASDFQNAGYGEQFFEQLQFIVEDEQSHVQLLTGAIQGAGQAPVCACTYNFPYSDVQSFVALSSLLEGVGTSAYLGAAPLVTDKTILTTAASITVTEALHTSQQRGALKEVAAANALGTPLDANAIFTLAASFIVECPATNAALPFTAFPALAVDASSCSGQQASGNHSMSRRTDYGDTFNESENTKRGMSSDAKGGSNQVIICAAPKAGEGAKFQSSVAIPPGSFLTFVSGLSTISVQATISEVSIEAAVPEGISGQSYVFVTKTAISGMIMDSDIVSGPAVMEVTPGAPMIDNTIL